MSSVRVRAKKFAVVGGGPVVLVHTYYRYVILVYVVFQSRVKATDGTEFLIGMSVVRQRVLVSTRAKVNELLRHFHFEFCLDFDVLPNFHLEIITCPNYSITWYCTSFQLPSIDSNSI